MDHFSLLSRGKVSTVLLAPVEGSVDNEKEKEVKQLFGTFTNRSHLS